MARYRTTIESSLSQADAFGYMADFSNTLQWDPSVSAARRLDDGPLRTGSRFALVSRFAGRDVPLEYAVVELDEPRLVVLEARNPRFFSHDRITIEPAAGGSRVHYDALVRLSGLARIADPILALLFTRVGNRATRGMRAALNP